MALSMVAIAEPPELPLTGERTLAGQAPQRTTHFRATVRLGRTPPAARPAERLHGEGPGVAAADLYAVYFHGPAYQVLERAWVRDGIAVGLLPAALPAAHHPPERPLAFAPRLVELCFQTAGLHEMRGTRRMGLPARLGRVEVLGDGGASAGRLTAVVHHRGAGPFDAVVVDETGNALVRLEGYRTAALPEELPEAALRRLSETPPAA